MPLNSFEDNGAPPYLELPQPIVGGWPTIEFPDCCAIGNETGYFCSGTLIAPNLVVTAQHCGAASRVFVGGYDINRPETGYTLAVQQELSHPTADIKVLVLAQDAVIPPRHVAQGPEVNGKWAVLVGFGSTDASGTALTFGRKHMVTNVPVIALEYLPSLEQQYGCHPGELIAGRPLLQKDTCAGDSGGPLYVAAATGEYYLVGATSRATLDRTQPCGDGGIYVRVDVYLDWIRQQTGRFINGAFG